MIVPMKKVSLIIKDEKREETLKILRKLGIIQIDIREGSSERLTLLQEQIALLESAIFLMGKTKSRQDELNLEESLSVARDITHLDEERSECLAERIAVNTELERLKSWGEIVIDSINDLNSKGFEVLLYEMPKTEYKLLTDGIKTLRISSTKSSVKFLILKSDSDCDEEILSSLSAYRVVLPQMSTAQMKHRLSDLNNKIDEINNKIQSYECYVKSIKDSVEKLVKEIEYETYATGMSAENLSTDIRQNVSVAYFKGYIEAENVGELKQSASDNHWGILIEEPSADDDVPTKLKNNKLVSLIYPLTDFLGTVPGYFEYDISGWFLTFILIFFGIIFGDGGYGLLICAVTTILIAKTLFSKKSIPPALLLVELFGLSTVMWGTLTCTWFGLPAQQLPNWLQSLSVPVISNVYADKIWYPFWTNGTAGLTTAQNLQILCFTLALVQLTVAHIKGLIRNRKSAKLLGDVGSIFQLLGIFYLVLSLVVNASVFSFGLVISSIPVGTVAIALIGIGFVLSFVFSNYEGNLLKSLLSSLKNIVSVLLGVVNVFSDIVSYIRLWAVGLAGAAISATVNELAGPLLGNFMFMILAIVLLAFGHGLNMILNILSVIVHGIRLNTLEFSSHLDMSWSGHKFKPFKE